MSSLHLASGRRSLLSAFTQASTSAGSRARSTLATPWVIRSTSKPATTTIAQTQIRQRSTLATPWVIRSTSKPSTTTAAQTQTRQRSTLATPWVIKPTSSETVKTAGTNGNSGANTKA